MTLVTFNINECLEPCIKEKMKLKEWQLATANKSKQQNKTQNDHE